MEQMMQLLKALQEIMEKQTCSLASWMQAKADIHLKEIRAGQEHLKEETKASQVLLSWPRCKPTKKG
jgi:hypothetical protein